MHAYLKYVKYLFYEYRDYPLEERIAAHYRAKKIIDLPEQIRELLAIGRNYTLLNVRGLLYRTRDGGKRDPYMDRFLRYVDDVEMAVAKNTLNYKEWRAAAEAVLRTFAEAVKLDRARGNTANKPVVALDPETWEPLAVFDSQLEACGVVGACFTGVGYAIKRGGKCANVYWQALSDWKKEPMRAARVSFEKDVKTKAGDVFERGVGSLI